MSRDGLLHAMAALDERTSVAGTITIDEPLVLTLPDGSERGVEGPGFVSWLLSHGEAAPFGVGHETRLDPTVRSAVRLAARFESATSDRERARARAMHVHHLLVEGPAVVSAVGQTQGLHARLQGNAHAAPRVRAEDHALASNRAARAHSSSKVRTWPTTPSMSSSCWALAAEE